MSKLYGTLGGDGRAKEQNRSAQTQTFAAARSYEGSVIVQIWYSDAAEEPNASIEVADGSQSTGRQLWTGKLAALVNAKSITVNEKGAS